jgi:hypothetical protein
VCGVPFVGESHGVDGKSTSILQETGKVVLVAFMAVKYVLI